MIILGGYGYTRGIWLYLGDMVVLGECGYSYKIEQQTWNLNKVSFLTNAKKKHFFCNPCSQDFTN